MRALKSVVLRACPERLLVRAKRLRYPRLIRKYRPPHHDVLRALVRPGDEVIDIGANIGWFTRVFSELVGPTGRVFSIEPVPPTFALLGHCVHELRLGNVELLNDAVSDRIAAVVMEVPRYDGGGDNYYQARVTAGPASDSRLRTFRVSVAPLDTLLARRLRRLTFVKCDVEGHELSVVRGARATIATWRPALLVEVGGDPDERDSPARTLMTELAEAGYTSYRFKEGHLAPREPGQRAVDYFFLTEDHVRVLRAGGLVA